MRQFTVTTAALLALSLSACGGEFTAVEAAADEAAAGDTSTPPGTTPTTAAPSTEEAAPAPSKDPVLPADPFVAPKEKWTWVDVDGMQCANGAPTGVGVNLTDKSDDVIVFLQGGGACWDGASCWGPVATAFYVNTGYGRVEFMTDVQRPLMLPLRRGDSNNPFRDVNMVYVPYCTGDVHAGDAVQNYEYLGEKKVTHHHGYKNLGRVLDTVAASFPKMKKLYLAGDSAGGFGSALNMDRTQRRFPNARVDVLDDSGQPIQPGPGKWESWQKTWNLQLPEGCPSCGADISNFIDYYRRTYPNNRFGLISYTNDSVITAFMSLAPTTFYDELFALADRMDGKWPNGQYYFLPGALHVGLATPTPGLVDWVEKFVKDDPSWKSDRPW